MRGSLILLLLISMVMAGAASASTEHDTTIPLFADCTESCGAMVIPYPFGIAGKYSCSRPGFSFVCNYSSDPPTLLLADGVTQVIGVSLDNHTISVRFSIAAMSANEDSLFTSWTSPPGAPYAMSPTSVTMTVVGCSATAYLLDLGTNKIIGSCITDCSDREMEAMEGAACSGIGCCQATFLSPVRSFAINLTRHDRQSGVASSVKAFVSSAQAVYRFRKEDLFTKDTVTGYTMAVAVLEWAFIEQSSCEDAAKNTTTYACLSTNSVCSNTKTKGLGYYCECSSGFEGNPYISGGCLDIDECAYPEKYSCTGICVNYVGGYTCCPPGSHVDSRLSCVPPKSQTIIMGVVIGVSIGFGLLLMLLCAVILNRRLKEMKLKKLKERYFHQNHGLLLRRLIATDDVNAERTKIFPLEELEKATNSFDPARILGHGGHGTVYKGILSDQRVVAIKKSKIVIQREIDQFINEVAILSQINHRNIVKLYGCCLETEVPLLVYEFITNGTLADHLHVEDRSSSLSWKDRLRIAVETVGALAYLHSAASISVFHRDVKSSNVLLDDTYTAKVSDFGASRTVPVDQTHVVTGIQGTHGYLDPEYYHTGQLTEKSDVYSLGVILVELLTGFMPVSLTRFGDRNLAMYFIWALKSNRVSDVLEARIKEEAMEEELEEMVGLAEECLRLKGAERPTMKEVEIRLQGLRRRKKKEQVQLTHHQSEEAEPQLCDPYGACRHQRSLDGNLADTAIQDTSRRHSLEEEFMLSLNYPR
ncbi:wall-associated receptor kinase 3 [Musa acuminata AAA Group]|uniref:wall-associated receptor kinase 3 n=1 Tax=Musa acuminata AAA Group TaxID=214697 RepID=UPI0031E3B216